MTLLLDQLTALDRAHPRDHKLLVGPDVNYGRELLLALARRTGGWIGWDATTLGMLARELAATTLGRSGLRSASDLETAALCDQALMETISARVVGSGFRELAFGVGFRRTVRDALLELRVAGIAPDRLAGASPPGTAAHDLAAVLTAYERRLSKGGLIDAGGILAAGLAEFDREIAFVLPGPVVVAPGLTPRGLSAVLLDRLLAHGAVRLDAPPRRPDGPTGSHCTAMDAFRATTPLDELREMARRIRAEGLRWDEVEVVTTDPDAYAVALHALASPLEIPMTVLNGLPVSRTRLGRALERWLVWLETGLPAERISAALDTGDLAAAHPLVPAAFHALGIGWGRARYEQARARLMEGDLPPAPHDRGRADPEAAAVWAEACAETAKLLGDLLACTPPAPEFGAPGEPSLAAGALARCARAFLAMMSEPDDAEAAARGRLVEWLGELESVRTEEVPFAVAVAELRDTLSDFRAWSAMGPDGKPWLSSGGAVHLTDLAHAGAGGRARTFVVGLDADRCVGPRLQDPFLPDQLRAALGGGLATTAARRAERRELLERTFAGLAGRVTLSYSIESDGGREAAPAPILLAAARHFFGLPGLNYDELRTQLGPPASPVPAPAAQPLDGRDVWFHALARGALLTDGSPAVRAAFPRLTSGLEAGAAWDAEALHPQHGLVPAAGRFDPRTRPDHPVSASSLETLARCPRAWLYDYGLGLVLPEEPVFDPGRWLDPAGRGSLLHEVFERFGRAYAGRQGELGLATAETDLLATGDAVIAEWLRQVPAPSDAVFEREREEIREALRGFLLMERQLPPGRTWQAFELGFGRGDRAVSLPLPDAEPLALTGRLDRVDRLPDGTLIVVDYKTGSARRFARDPKRGLFAGGRQLQAGLYAHAAKELVGGAVARFEYRFPSERGQHRIVPFDADELGAAPALVAELLDEIRRGHFLPTTSSDDCRYCDFRQICRVRDLPYNKVASPRAEWAEAHAEVLPEYGLMRRRRGADR